MVILFHCLFVIAIATFHARFIKWYSGQGMPLLRISVSYEKMALAAIRMHLRKPEAIPTEIVRFSGDITTCVCGRQTRAIANAVVVVYIPVYCYPGPEYHGTLRKNC